MCIRVIYNKKLQHYFFFKVSISTSPKHKLAIAHGNRANQIRTGIENTASYQVPDKPLKKEFSIMSNKYITSWFHSESDNETVKKKVIASLGH